MIAATINGMRCKIIYHVGRELTLKTKVCSGVVTFQSESVCILGASTLTIPFSSITTVEMFRLNGLGRMIKLVFAENTIYLSAVRLNLFGYFVVGNFFKTGELYESLKGRIPKDQPN